MRYVIGQRPSPRSSNPSRVMNPRMNNAFSDLRPLFPYPVSYPTPTIPAPNCYMGVNGQMICPRTTSMRSRGAGPQPVRQVANSLTSPTCVVYPNGVVYCP